MQQRMSDSEEEEPQEAEEEYPPWLAVVLDDDDSDHYDRVVLLDDGGKGGGGSLRDWVEVKAIEAPDTQDAAAGKGPGSCRTYVIRRYSTILIASEPLVPPYIGLVDKVFRKRDAKSCGTVNGKPLYRLADFGVHAYWFYRPHEMPDVIWPEHKALRRHMQGCAQYKLPGKAKVNTEQYSERQVLFSSHHTLHDYPDDKGVQLLESFLQACKVHWVGVGSDVPYRYQIHGSTLVRVDEPGFVVRGFLWCNSKDQPQYGPDSKRAFDLTATWPDRDTMDIVKVMCSRYQQELQRLTQRNRAVVGRYHAAKAAGKQTVPSEDGEDPPATKAPGPRAPAAAGAAAGAAAKVAPAPTNSPRLEGVAGLPADPADNDDLNMLLDW